MATTIYCLAPECRNNSQITEGSDPPVFYHRIKDDLKWYKFCCLNDTQTISGRPELAICSVHFELDFYLDGHILKENAFPTIPSPIGETSKMCYVCFSPESDCTLIPIEEETIKELALIKLELVKGANVPTHLCTECNKEISQFLDYCANVRSANDYWAKHGLNVERNMKGIGVFDIENKLQERFNEVTVKTEPDAMLKYETMETEENPYMFEENSCQIDIVKNEPISDEEDSLVTEHKSVNESNDDKMMKTEKEVNHKIFDDISSQIVITKRKGPFTDVIKKPITKKDKRDNISKTKRKATNAKEIKAKVNKEVDVVKKCADCNVAFTGKELIVISDLHRHIWNYHCRPEFKAPKTCWKCKYIFTIDCNCRKPFFIHHVGQRCTCKNCGKINLTPGQLFLHKTQETCSKVKGKVIHGIVNKTLKDKRCKAPVLEVLNGKGTVLYNIFNCRFCKKSYDTKETLEEHEKQHVKIGAERPYVCTECEKCFLQDRSLRSHVKQHVGELLFKCSYCKKKFYTKRRRDAHQYQHKSINQSVSNK